MIWGTMIYIDLRRWFFCGLCLFSVFFLSGAIKAQSLKNKVESLAKKKQFDQAMKLLFNAYKTDPKSSYKIGQAVSCLFRPMTSIVEEAKPPPAEKLTKQKIAEVSDVLNKIITLSKFYYKMRRSLHSLPKVYCLEYLPYSLQTRFRRYFHTRFKKRLEDIKKRYNYSSKPEKSFERLQVQVKYLDQIYGLLPVWSCEYWQIYFAPELRKYIHDATCYLAEHPDEYYPDSIENYLYVREFTSGDGQFNIEAFNEHLDILQSIIDGSVLTWKISVLENLEGINRKVLNTYNCMKMDVFDSDGPKKKYYEVLTSQVNATQLFGILKDDDKQAEFMKELFRQAVGAPRQVIGSIERYNFSNGKRCAVRNGKVDVEYFKLGARAGIFMQKQLYSLSRADRAKITKLIASITSVPEKQVKSESTRESVKKEVKSSRVVKQEKSKSFQTPAKKGVKSENKSESQQTVKKNYKSIDRKSRPQTARKKYGIHRFFKNFKKIYSLQPKGKYKPAGCRREIGNSFLVYTLIDGKNIYMPSICESGQYFTLLCLNMETMKVSPVVQYDFRSQYRRKYDRFALMEKYVIHYNTKDGINLIPKAGGKVINVKMNFSDGQQISTACIAKGKMYFWKYLCSSNHNKAGGDLFVFDPNTKKLKKLYSSFDDNNHTFGKNICSFSLRGGWYCAADNSLIFYVEKYSCCLWKYYLDSGEWECIWRHKRGLRYCAFIDKYNVYKFEEKNRGNYLLALKSGGNGLKRFAKEFGMSKVKQDIDTYILQFAFKKRYRFSVWPGCFISGKKLILPKERCYVDFKSFKPSCIFIYNDKRYCITTNKTYQGITDIYIGELEPNRTMKMECPENRIQILNQDSKGK